MKIIEESLFEFEKKKDPLRNLKIGRKRKLPKDKNVPLSNSKIPKELLKVIKNIFSNTSEVINFLKDPEVEEVYMIIFRDNDINGGYNETDDERLDKYFSSIIWVKNEDESIIDNVGESLVNYFSNILENLGYSWEAIHDMKSSKNYTKWEEYREEEYYGFEW